MRKEKDGEERVNIDAKGREERNEGVGDKTEGEKKDGEVQV